MLDNWLQTEKDNTPWMGIMCTCKNKKEKIPRKITTVSTKTMSENYGNLTKLSHDAIVRKKQPEKLENVPARYLTVCFRVKFWLTSDYNLSRQLVRLCNSQIFETSPKENYFVRESPF